jgi:hypothetical protein
MYKFKYIRLIIRPNLRIGIRPGYPQYLQITSPIRTIFVNPGLSGDRISPKKNLHRLGQSIK